MTTPKRHLENQAKIPSLTINTKNEPHNVASSEIIVLEVSESIDVPGRIASVPAKPQITEEVLEYIKMRELMKLLQFIKRSLLVSFLLTSIAVLSPNSHQVVNKELLSEMIYSQVVLLKMVLNCLKSTEKQKK